MERAEATGGLAPTPSEAGDCCLRGKDGGSIGEGKMEMQPAQEDWPLRLVTFFRAFTFQSTRALAHSLARLLAHSLSDRLGRLETTPRSPSVTRSLR